MTTMIPVIASSGAVPPSPKSDSFEGPHAERPSFHGALDEVQRRTTGAATHQDGARPQAAQRPQAAHKPQTSQRPQTPQRPEASPRARQGANEGPETETETKMESQHDAQDAGAEEALVASGLVGVSPAGETQALAAAADSAGMSDSDLCGLCAPNGSDTSPAPVRLGATAQAAVSAEDEVAQTAGQGDGDGGESPSPSVGVQHQAPRPTDAQSGASAVESLLSSRESALVPGAKELSAQMAPLAGADRSQPSEPVVAASQGMTPLDSLRAASSVEGEAGESVEATVPETQDVQGLSENLSTAGEASSRSDEGTQDSTQQREGEPQGPLMADARGAAEAKASAGNDSSFGSQVRRADAALAASPVRPSAEVSPAWTAQGPNSVRVDVTQSDGSPLQLHVSLVHQTVYARVVTNQADVQDFLARNQARLEASLERQGLEVGQFFVDAGPQQEGRSPQEWSARQPGAYPAAGQVDLSHERAAAPTVPVPAGRRLNLVL